MPSVRAELEVISERLQIGFVGERAFGLRLFHHFLFEIRHLCSAVRFIKGDAIGERLHGAFARGEIGIQIVFEFVEQNGLFGIAPAFKVENFTGSTIMAPACFMSAMHSSISAVDGGLMLKYWRAMPKRAPRRPVGSQKRV